jgi:hypothetical protein
VDHGDRDVGLAALQALGSVDRLASAHVAKETLSGDLAHAVAVLQALVAVDSCSAADPLRSALVDELDLLRRRALACLALRYDPAAMATVAYRLAQRNSRTHALALEWLDVTLAGEDAAAVALLDPELVASERLARLARWFPAVPRDLRSTLQDLVEDADDRWRRPWLSACAYAAGIATAELGGWEPDMDEADDPSDDDGAAADDDDGADVDGERRILRETVTALRRRRPPQTSEGSARGTHDLALRGGC